MKKLETIAFLLFFVAVALAVGCAKPPDPDDSVVNHSGTLNGHDFVDLGLPSGTFWASCNLGADAPEDCGDYLAWGETAPKVLYDWKNYQFSCFVDGCYKLTKYCTEPSMGFNGFVDDLTVLEQADDALRTYWGEGWRMPTKEEWAELLENTTCVWTTQNGVDGRRLTGPNGNSIFLPATGFCLENEPICMGLGVYWSSTLQTGSQVSAWSFHFDFENCHVCGTYERSRGQCIRGVLSE